MPLRQLNGLENHAALIHALAHIEFNAINLALDVVQRFPACRPSFMTTGCAWPAEEAYHFSLLRDHLRAAGQGLRRFPRRTMACGKWP